MSDVQKVPMRELLNGLKNEATVCESCRRSLDRKVLMKGTQHMLKGDIYAMTERVTPAQWDAARHDWKCVCRRCANVLSSDASTAADIRGFYFYLLGCKTISPLSVNEYIARLRRMAHLLTPDQLDHAVICGSLADYVGSNIPERDAPNYSRVLMKYIEYCFANLH